MALDKSKAYGWHLGGVLDGCIGQDGHNYRPDGAEVDDNGKPVTKAAKPAAKPTPQAAPEPAVNEQLAAQLKA